jgi:hypothetical protein
MIVSQLASLRSSSGFGHRFVTDGLGNEKLELIAPDLMMWSDASNVRGMLTTYMLHLFPEKMFELFTRGIDDNAVGIARAHKPQLVNELECRIIEAELEEMSLIEQAQHLAREVDRIAGLEQQRLAVVLDDLGQGLAARCDDGAPARHVLEDLGGEHHGRARRQIGRGRDHAHTAPAP